MASKGKITIQCETCGKTFERYPSDVKLHTFCGEKCFTKWWSETIAIRARVRTENRRVERKCPMCGKDFTVIRSWTKKEGAGTYCSRTCFNAYKRTITGENHPLYTQVTCTCQFCGKEYKSKKSLAERSKFCSYQCHGAYRALHSPKRTTGIEVAVERMLQESGVEYEKQKPMGAYVCDFYVRSAKLVIECDGVYWHNIPEVKKRDKRKDGWLTAHKQRILRLKERDINRNPDWCKLQILIAVAG